MNSNTHDLLTALAGMMVGLPIAGVIMVAVAGFLLGGKGAKGSPLRAVVFAFLAVLLFAVFGSVIIGLVQYLWNSGGGWSR